MPFTSFKEIYILGVTRSGKTFRPSDWAERLAGLTSAFGHDQKLSYSPFVRPVAIRGVKAVIVSSMPSAARTCGVTGIDLAERG